MMLPNAKQIRDWDAYTILHEPIASVDLMERAAKAFKDALLIHLNELDLLNGAIPYYVFCGPGNNGGDGLAVARLLHEMGLKVSVYNLSTGSKPSNDFALNLKRLQDGKQLDISFLQKESDFPEIHSSSIIIDALFGTGLNKPLIGLAASLIQYLNDSKGYKVSIDLPSGLMADLDSMDLNSSRPVFKAQQTFTFQVPKQCFMLAENFEFVGNFEVLPIGLHPDFLLNSQNDIHFISSDWVQSNFKVREKFSHKGSFGHALLVAGSFGKIGAALLAAKAALRVGCGLLTAYIPKVGYSIFQTALPEAMVQTDDELYELRNFPDTAKFDCVGVGPGMGLHPYTVMAFGNWLKQIKKPLLIDADGLNACAQLMKLNEDFSFPEMAVITPHSKEFERLAGKCEDSLARLKRQKEFAIQHKIIVVLKGAHTSIALPDGSVYFNMSGNPLLSTAGSGDVLSGIITSLLAQGYEPKTAALLGVHLHGTLADRLKSKGVKHAIAGDFIEELKFV